MDATRKKNARRLRRKHHIRKRVSGTADRPRLTVTRSLQHLYCQAIDDSQGVTLAASSTVNAALRETVASSGGTREGAAQVGADIARRLKELGVARVCFDRNGYKYHGRIAALADAVRKEGIEV